MLIMGKIITSKRFSLKLRDYLKGVLLAVLVPVLVAVQQSLEAGHFEFDYLYLAKVAVGALVGYLLKNFFDKPKVVITANSNTHAENIKNAVEE